MPNQQIKVTQSAEKPVPVEIIADAILSISKGVKALVAGPLNERALVLLITNASPPMGATSYNRTPVTQTMVKAVLAGIGSLEREYLKPKK